MTVCTSENPSQAQSEAPRKWTKAAVLALARRITKNANLREYPNAATAAEREANNAKRKALATAREAANKEITSMGDFSGQLRKLLDAVRFCCDVDAGEPSLSQLKAARATADHFINLVESRPLRKDIDALDTHSYRFSAGVDRGFCWEVIAQGDTLADLAAKLLAKAGGQQQ